jgi:hypothetical protein
MFILMQKNRKRVFMATWPRKPVPQIAAILGAMLLLNSWSGISPLRSQTQREQPYIPPVEGDILDQPAHSATAPDAGLPTETKQKIQAALRKLGYYDGPIDGLFGDQTRQAIRSYQTVIRSRPTGYLTTQDTDLLLARLDPAPGWRRIGSGCTGPRSLFGFQSLHTDMLTDGKQ